MTEETRTMEAHRSSAQALDDIQHTVRQFIVTNFLFGKDPASLTPQSSFLEGGIIDSTGILEMIQFVERTYGIQVDDTEMVPECLDSLDNISRFIRRKLTSP
jgi:acyl carrier protein